MCALFFFCFSVRFFFFLHSPLLTPSAARRERHAYCDFEGGRRNGGAWSRRSCMAVMFCWWCIHCVGAVRVKSWQAAPPHPAPWLLPPPRVASMFYALCCAQRLRSDSNSNCSSGFWGLSLGSDSGSGFRFWVCGLSLVWTETRLETGMETGTGPEMESGLCGPAVDRVCCLGSHRCDWGLFMAHGFWVTFWYHVLAANFPSPSPFLSLSFSNSALA